MFGWGERKRAHERLLAQMAMDQQRYLADTIREMSAQQATTLEKVGAMVGTLAASSQKSSDVLQTWLEGFKVASDPQTSVVTDEDEVRATVARALATDDGILPTMPEGLPPEFQLAWALRHDDSN